MRPLIIIGAPRSGTNALRDALCATSAFHTWPCDELNPLWRTRNSRHATDELPASAARPEVRSEIRAAFAKRAAIDPAAMVVEKTCANTLRLPFVHAVFPDAAFVEIVRDGRDATASAALRWKGEFELGYSLEKLRWVPRHELPKLVVRQLRNRRQDQIRPVGAAVAQWGPVWSGLHGLTASGATADEVSGRQWIACVRAHTEFFDRTGAPPSLRIRYEDFVADPGATLTAVAAFAGKTLGAFETREAASSVHAGSIGKWKNSGLTEAWPSMHAALAPELALLDYR